MVKRWELLKIRLFLYFSLVFTSWIPDFIKSLCKYVSYCLNVCLFGVGFFFGRRGWCVLLMDNLIAFRHLFLSVFFSYLYLHWGLIYFSGVLHSVHLQVWSVCVCVWKGGSNFGIWIQHQVHQYNLEKKNFEGFKCNFFYGFCLSGE